MAEYIFTSESSLPTKLEIGDTVVFNHIPNSTYRVWNPYNNGVSKIKIKCWGAQGGSFIETTRNNGGYSEGEYTVKNQNLYFYTGEKPDQPNEIYMTWRIFNGGQASFVSLLNNINDSIIIAGGGGGSVVSASNYQHGGAGGGLSAENGEGQTPGIGGTQDSGLSTNIIGQRGYRKNHPDYSAAYAVNGGGGGGYRAGSAGKAVPPYAGTTTSGGGGGSGYIGGVQNGSTQNGVNEGHGKIVVEIMSSYDIEIDSLKPSYESPENIQFTIIGQQPQTVIVKLDNNKIKEYASPNIGEQIDLQITDEQFLILSNGDHVLQFIIIENEVEQFVKAFNYIKNSQKQIIVTTPIQLQTSNVIVDLNLNILKGDNMAIEACNNGFDESPIWVDVTDKVTKGKNFQLTNDIKTNENWGLSFKITSTGEYEMSSIIIGGYHENI